MNVHAFNRRSLLWLRETRKKWNERRAKLTRVGFMQLHFCSFLLLLMCAIYLPLTAFQCLHLVLVCHQHQAKWHTFSLFNGQLKRRTIDAFQFEKSEIGCSAAILLPLLPLLDNVVHTLRSDLPVLYTLKRTSLTCKLPRAKERPLSRAVFNCFIA